jgi:hypothetical protein
MGGLTDTIDLVLLQLTFHPTLLASALTADIDATSIVISSPYADGPEARPALYDLPELENDCEEHACHENLDEQKLCS